MLKFAMYFAMFVGALAIAAWVSREASYFFNSLFYYVRYHWLPFLGGVALIAIIYKVLSSKS
jgi:multisubunit Na+/H+ antiporter MnhB subunit